MKPLGSIAALAAAIRDDADVEADAITASAAQTIAAITSEPACPPAAGDERTITAARERARVRVAQEDWHDAREAVAEREAWIQNVIAVGVRRLRERQSVSEARETLGALAREAIARLPAGGVDIVVSSADAALLDRDWCAAIAPGADAAAIRIVAGPVDGGCIARSADGRASFDNSYAARTERLQAAWRGALSDLYERVTQDIPVASRTEP